MTGCIAAYTTYRNSQAVPQGLYTRFFTVAQITGKEKLYGENRKTPETVKYQQLTGLLIW
jgi:hypothetical protein